MYLSGIQSLAHLWRNGCWWRLAAENWETFDRVVDQSGSTVDAFVVEPENPSREGRRDFRLFELSICGQCSKINFLMSTYF
jgi:hypothetical protein